MKQIYLDHAATTPLDPRVKAAMEPYFDKIYGNPSSFHSVGKAAKDAVEEARESVAKILNCRAREVVFVNGGTESDNLAVLGAARANHTYGHHIITTKIEHPAVLSASEYLEKKESFEVTYLGVDKNGLVDPKDIEQAIIPDTILVSVMYANNEIGTILPLREIAKVIRKKRQEIGHQFPLFHTDACQAAGALDLDTQKLGVDLLTLNGSKIYGPKGIGLLYVKSGVKLEPLLFGGGQEKGLRSGTLNVPAIVGLSRALSIAQSEKEKENKRLIKLRDMLILGILKKIPKTKLNGHPEIRLPNNINVSVAGAEGEALVLYLDSFGISASTGSACSSASLKPSHALLAIGLSSGMAHSSLRFTLGKKTTKKDIDYVLKVLPSIVRKLRSVSAVKS